MPRGAPQPDEASRVDPPRKPSLKRSGTTRRRGQGDHHGMDADAVLETSPLGIVMTDRAGRIVRTNRRLEQMFGYERNELAGGLLETLLPERFRSIHERHRGGFFTDPRVRPMGLGLELAALRKD